MKIGFDRKECKKLDVEITNTTFSNRGGLSFMVRQIDNTGICTMSEKAFGHLGKSSSGETKGPK